MYIKHNDTYYDLSKFNQIVLGNSDEILLANISHSGDWDELDEKNICILLFPSQRERDFAWLQLENFIKSNYNCLNLGKFSYAS